MGGNDRIPVQPLKDVALCKCDPFLSCWQSIVCLPCSTPTTTVSPSPATLVCPIPWNMSLIMHRPMAGIWREITSASVPVKIEAPRGAKEAAVAGDIHKFIGNGWADRWAKRGAQLHQVSKDDAKAWKRHLFVGMHMLAHAAQTRGSWPYFHEAFISGAWRKPEAGHPRPGPPRIHKDGPAHD